MTETYGNQLAFDKERDGLLVVFPEGAKPMPNGEMPCKEYFTHDKVYCLMENLELVNPDNSEHRSRAALYVLEHLPEGQMADFFAGYIMHMITSDAGLATELLENVNKKL